MKVRIELDDETIELLDKVSLMIKINDYDNLIMFLVGYYIGSEQNRNDSNENESEICESCGKLKDEHLNGQLCNVGILKGKDMLAKTFVPQDVCECGHKKQDHIWDNHGKEILGSCSYDNPVCDCQEFQVPDKNETPDVEDEIKKELDKDYEK